MHQIGVGVLGPVFRTYEPSKDRLVAVKAFHLDVTPEQAHTLVEALERLVVSGLDHPGVVASLAVGLEDDVPYLAQEYVAAESLDVAIRHYSPASIETAMPFIRQIGAALDAAHGQGVQHGALHLRDIFVSPDEARVTGFGIVKALEELGLAGPIRRPYSAPEVISGFGWGGAADRFALAAIAYELLTGRRAAGTGDQVTERIRSIEGVADPEHLEEVFAIALADDPDDRYSSAARFVSALEFGVGDELGGSVDAKPDSDPQRGTASLDLLAGLELRRDSLDADPTLDPIDRLESADARDVGEAGVREDAEFDDNGVLDGRGVVDPVDPVEPLDLDPEVSVGATEHDDAVDDIVVDRSARRVSGSPEFQLATRANELSLDYAEEQPTDDEEADGGQAEPGTDLDAVAQSEDAPLDLDASGPETSRFDAFDFADDGDGGDGGDDGDDSDALDGGEDDVDDAASADLYAGENGYAANTLRIEDTEHTDRADDTYDVDDPDEDGALEEIPVLPPAALVASTQRSGWGRVVGPVLAIALVVGGIAYFVGLALAPSDGPTDQVLDSQSAAFDPADPANRELSEGVAGAGFGAPPAGSSPDPGLDPGSGSTPPEAVAVDAGVEPGSISETPRAISAADVPASSAEAETPPASATASAVSVLEANPPTGWLLVRTDPPGATVTLDGVARGRTPLSLRDVSFGTHRLEVSRAGFERVERQVTVSEQENVVPVGVELAPAGGSSLPDLRAATPGSLAVQSRPPGARVTVDGTPAGVTPVVVALPVGSHQVRIEGDGYQAWVTNVEVTSDDRVQVNASLERLTR